MKEKEKSPSERGTCSKEKIKERSIELQSHIHILRGLISYHERMITPIAASVIGQCGEREICPAVKFADDVYLAAIKESLRLMERELEGLVR